MPQTSVLNCRTGLPDFDAGAWGTIKNYCGWHVAPSRTETLTVTARHRSPDLYLPTLYITDLEKIEIKTRYDNEWREIDPSRYDWDTIGLVRVLGGCWPRRLRGIRVTLTHGYELEEVPELVTLADAIARRSRQNLGGVASQSVNGASVSYQTAGGAPLSVPLLAIEKEMLEKYRVGRGRIPG